LFSTAVIGIEPGKHAPARLSCIPKLRTGGYFPGFLEPRRMAEKALTAVVQVYDLVQAMGMTGISNSQVSRLCAEIDERVKAFRVRSVLVHAGRQGRPRRLRLHRDRRCPGRCRGRLRSVVSFAVGGQPSGKFGDQFSRARDRVAHRTGGKLMKIPRRKFMHLVAGGAALPAMSYFAWALDYPTRPVHMIVGLAAGGPTDVMARIVAQSLSERLGKQFPVENRTGAAAHSPPR
jgi:hypothetical protein